MAIRSGSRINSLMYGDDPYSSDNTVPTQDGPTYSVEDPAPAQRADDPAPAPTQPAQPTFDPNQQVGHNGTTSSGLTREQYRDLWQSSGAKSMQDLQNFVNQYGGSIVSGNGT